MESIPAGTPPQCSGRRKTRAPPGFDKVVAEWVAIAIVFALRMLALRYGIKAPEPVDVPHHVRRTVLGNRRARRRGIRVYRAGDPGHAKPGRHGPASRPGGTPPSGDDG